MKRKIMSYREMKEWDEEGLLNNYDDDSPFGSYEEMIEFEDKKWILKEKKK